MENLTVAFVLVFIVQGVRAEGPDFSKYDFEEKVLEKMVRMEFQMERQKVELSEALQAIVDVSNISDAKIREFDKLIKTYSVEIKTNFSDQNERFYSMLSEKMEEIKLMQGDTIVFPEALHNDGGYDPNTGIFTATVNGTYIFTVRLCPKNDRYVQFSFKVDGTEQDAITFFGDGGYSCKSADTVILLKKEQKLWLYVKYAQSDSAVSGSEYRWNTFTGLVF